MSRSDKAVHLDIASLSERVGKLAQTMRDRKA